MCVSAVCVCVCVCVVCARVVLVLCSRFVHVVLVLCSRSCCARTVSAFVLFLYCACVVLVLCSSSCCARAVLALMLCVIVLYLSCVCDVYSKKFPELESMVCGFIFLL